MNQNQMTSVDPRVVEMGKQIGEAMAGRGMVLILRVDGEKLLLDRHMFNFPLGELLHAEAMIHKDLMKEAEKIA